jgi:ABC-type oligopeptide transport system substrate-binding subunit
VAVLLLLMGTTTVMAAGTGEASQATETFLVEVTVEGDGQWTLSFGGMDMGIASSTFNALSTRFGLGLASPVVDSNMLKMAADAGVDEFALVKEGAQTAVWINGEPLTALTVSDSAVVALTEVYVPELEGLLSWVNKTYMTVILHLPSSSGAKALDLSKTLGPIEEGEPTNIVSVAATVSPQGELLSVGGLAPSQLGLPAAWFDLSLLDMLASRRLTSVSA